MNEGMGINKEEQAEKQFLSDYNAGKYERPSVTVDMLIFTVTEERSGEL